MLEPPKPADEATRLAALKSLQVIDTPDEERFDRITRLAARLLDVPIAVISLVDSDRQWFKSKYGLDASEPPRDVSFCGHAILHDEPRVVTDATLAPRFADNPLVAAEPCIRFYAGHPLEAVGGSKLGTLCLIDHQPRQLSEAGRQCLHEICPVGHPPLNAFLGIPLYSGGTLVFLLLRETWMSRQVSQKMATQSADASQAQRVMDEIRSDFAQVRHGEDGREFRATFSCGIAMVPSHSHPAALIEAADKALYDAKRGGRNKMALAPGGG